MQNLMCLVIGYFFGCVSPAAIIAKSKGVDLRKSGSGNLGGTNTMLVIGPKYGFAVMILDALKAVFAGMLAARLTGPRLTALMEQVEMLREAQLRNMNNTLLLTRLCACLRQAAGY